MLCHFCLTAFLPGAACTLHSVCPCPRGIPVLNAGLCVHLSFGALEGLCYEYHGGCITTGLLCLSLSKCLSFHAFLELVPRCFSPYLFRQLLPSCVCNAIERYDHRLNVVCLSFFFFFWWLNGPSVFICFWGTPLRLNPECPCSCKSEVFC